MSNQETTTRAWHVRGSRLDLSASSILMGILNVTPDSFSDGGRYDGTRAAVERGLEMIAEGAEVVDIGGESTRPGFEVVAVQEEIKRVAPVIEGILARHAGAVISIDTSKVEVARAALEAGARVVNDIWGFQKEPELAAVAATFGAGVVLMRNGRDGESEGPILERVMRSWDRSIEIAESAGVMRESIVLDPGIGFGTTRKEDLEILRGLEELCDYGYPVLIGASRKRITAEPKGVPLDKRLEPTLATTVAGISAGVAIFRVHDVAENERAARMADLIYKGGVIDE